MNQAIDYKIRENGVVLIEFDLPDEKVNKLSTPVMERFDQIIDELAAMKQVKAAVIISGKDGNFIAGADVNEIKEINDAKEGEGKAAMGQAIFQKLNDLPFPVVAAIDGACVGGGTELILACHYRIASNSEKTKFSCPEVNIGILPGFGGTQRLPRLVGIQSALDMILTGRSIDSRKAKRIGLVDEVVPKELLREKSLEFTEKLIKKNRNERERNPKRQSMMGILLEKNSIGRAIVFGQAKKLVLKRTKGHYPAPLKALEAVKKGISMPLRDGLALEAKYLGELIATDICKNLVSLFFMNEGIKKESGVVNEDVEPLPISRAGILGAGVMGGGIAQIISYNDIPARMKDIKHEFVAKGLQAAREIYQARVNRRRMTKRELETKMSLISGTLDYSGFGLVDLVVEAVVEEMKIKKIVLQEFEEVAKETAIFASNTSSLSITELATASKRPENVAGMHFFNPVHRMPLVEVVIGEKTSDSTTMTIVAFAKKLGKTPVVVKDGAGFLVNRILGPYMNEACFLLEEGNKIEDIDKAMLDFGMPMGPIRLLDEVGIDVAFKVSGILEAAFSDRVKASGILQLVYDGGRLGKKNKKGFYIYDGKKGVVDEGVYSVIRDLGKNGIATGKVNMKNRMVLAMINEAARILEEGLVRKPGDVDMGMIMGTGFPPFRGGLLKYADSIGITRVVDDLGACEQKLGRRFEAAKLLKEMADNKECFYR